MLCSILPVPQLLPRASDMTCGIVLVILLGMLGIDFGLAIFLMVELTRDGLKDRRDRRRQKAEEVELILLRESLEARRR